MSDFVLTADNYYSSEADKRFMSVHQYLDFVGHMGVYGCEARAMAKLNGEWNDETTTAMLVGSYVDSYFEGTLEKFTEENPDCFTKTKPYGLKAPFKQAEKMIARCEQDPYFMSTLSGEKQVIMTGYLFGCEWKIKMDSYIPGKAIVDLKTSADIHKAWKVQDYGYASFVEYWAYTLQMAVYQKIVEINTGKKLPCYISVVTKEESPERPQCGFHFWLFGAGLGARSPQRTPCGKRRKANMITQKCSSAAPPTPFSAFLRSPSGSP